MAIVLLLLLKLLGDKGAIERKRNTGKNITIRQLGAFPEIGIHALLLNLCDQFLSLGGENRHSGKGNTERLRAEAMYLDVIDGILPIKEDKKLLLKPAIGQRFLRVIAKAVLWLAKNLVYCTAGHAQFHRTDAFQWLYVPFFSTHSVYFD